MISRILTQENFDKLDLFIKDNKDRPGPLMPVLQEGQKIFGALPLEVQRYISEQMYIPLAEIYGVVTFYSQFTLVPAGEFTVSVCMGTACYVRNSQAIADRLASDLDLKFGATSTDGKFTLLATRCIGACGLAPVMTVNEDVYGRLSENDIPTIMSKYK